MARPSRYWVRAADGARIRGFDDVGPAEAAALDGGDGTQIVDTLAQAYHPMLQEVRDGALVYAGYGGWDTGRLDLGRDFIEAVKKGHVALAEAFLAKGADVNARDQGGGPALHWAVGGGKAEIVRLLLGHGADPAARDRNGLTAGEVAARRGRAEIAGLLRAEKTADREAF
jgi:hypothetical protein